MAHFMIQTDGERGALLVDGEQPELFGALVGVNVRHDDLDAAPLAETSPFVLRARAHPVVEVTLRLPLSASDHLTVVQGARMDDVYGPTADGDAATNKEATGWRAEWDEEYGLWRPIVKFPGSLAGTLAGSLQGYGFASKADCLAFIRDNLTALGRMYPERPST